MHDPDQPSFRRLMRIPDMLIGMAVAQITFAASGDPLAPMTGQQVYNNVCIACHSPPGVGGAPALGDTDAWAPRIAQGMDTLIDHALNGFTGSTGVMPKKGERVDLSDEEIIEAVEYMVWQVDQ
jgi:cytochrome c5